MEREGADIGQEGRKGGSTDSSSQALDESRVFLEGRVEGFADREYVCVRRWTVRIKERALSLESSFSKGEF